MTRRVMAAIGMAGFVASAAVHLATFVEALAARLPDGVVLALFALAFVPLPVLVGRLRVRAAAARPGRRWAMLDARALIAPVPAGMRLVVGATAMYALLNLTLSLLLGLEHGASHAGELRLLSGHLLLLYLLPLTYFLFIDADHATR